MHAQPEQKRGPGRPPGSTRQKIEQQRLISGGGDAKGQEKATTPPYLCSTTSCDSSTLSLFLPPPPGKPLDGSPLKKKSKLDGDDGPVKPLGPAGTGAGGDAADAIKNNPRKWNVTQVCDFIKSMGYAEYVEDFVLQEIDGVALMLLDKDVLMSSMQVRQTSEKLRRVLHTTFLLLLLCCCFFLQMKLGPALKICDEVKQMQEKLKQN